MEGEAEADGDCFTPLTPGCENDVGGRFILGGWAAVLETAVAMVWGERAGGGGKGGERKERSWSSQQSHNGQPGGGALIGRDHKDRRQTAISVE